MSDWSSGPFSTQPLLLQRLFLAAQCKGLCTFLEHLTLHSRVLPISEHICTAEHSLVCSVQ